MREQDMFACAKPVFKEMIKNPEQGWIDSVGIGPVVGRKSNNY